MSGLLIVGGSGFVGGRLVQAAHEQGYTVSWTYASHRANLPGNALHADFSTEITGELDRYLTSSTPEVIVYSSSPSARADVLLHRQVNINGVQHILGQVGLARPKPLFIYLSTNAVFGGNGSRRENDKPDPEERWDELREYACTKAEAEQWLLREWPESLVVRTATVGGRKADGSWSRRLGAAIKELQSGVCVRRFNDRYISPTLVDDLVAALLEMMESSFGYRGIVHVAGSDNQMTDYTYTSLLARYLGCRETSVEAEPMSNVPAMRGSPRDTTLDTTFTQQLLHTRLRGAEEQLHFLLGSS